MSSSRASLRQHLEEPFQPGAVEIGHQPDQVFASLLGYRTGGTECTQQAIDPLAGFTELRNCRGFEGVTLPFDELSREMRGYASLAGERLGR